MGFSHGGPRSAQVRLDRRFHAHQRLPDFLGGKADLEQATT